jgi:predicted nucleic acid-binding protein
MTGWIFNASPVILLGKIHQLHLIELLSPSFRIPREVIEEIGAGCSDDPAVKWLKRPSLADHIVDGPTAPPFLMQWDLGAGETAVLSLALAENAAVVVLDDLAARKFAQTFQVPLLGTLGLLLRAKNAGLVGAIAPLIQGLESAGANLSPAVIAQAIALANEAL